MDHPPEIKYVFFGSSQMSLYVLDELEKAGYIPSAVVTTPDKPVGRKQVITPTPVKKWALSRNIKVYDPVKLDGEVIAALKKESADVFIVASYGKLIPAEVISIPPHQTLNVHPSLLPKYRGASPLQSAILDDAKDTGVTIMRIDELMDHGPIVMQKQIHVPEWPVYEVFEEMMAREGGKMLASIVPRWLSGTIKEREQDHAAATHCRKFTKEDGEIRQDDPYANFRKIQAFHAWPGTYFFIEKNGAKMRVKITAASFEHGRLNIEKVIPEGGKEMSYADFRRGYEKS
jgi:methionyl-tRNA formyltransferase